MEKPNKIIFDSNVILRFLVNDIPSQHLIAERIIKKIEQGKLYGLISILVVNEVIWILKTYYHVDKNVYMPQIIQLLAFDAIEIIEVSKHILMRSLRELQIKNLDFTDVYLIAIAEGREVFSFDKDFKKLKKN